MNDLNDLRGFNPEEQDDFGGADLVPAGHYTAALTSSSTREAKGNSEHKYLQLEFQIVQGEQKGRVVRTRLNLKNTNPTAVRIARAELAAIMKATGKTQVQSIEELFSIPIMIEVVVDPPSGEFGPASRIKAYRSRAAATTTVAQNTEGVSHAAASRKNSPYS